MPEGSIFDNPELVYFNNYSNTPWPAFDLPDFYCLPRAVEIVEQQGQWFKRHSDLPAPVSVVADDVERDFVTGQALLRGLGVKVDGHSFSTNAVPFHQGTTGNLPGCPQFTQEEVQVAVEAQLKRHPWGANFDELQEEMLRSVGVGAAGNWTESPCVLSRDLSLFWARLSGSCSVADAFSERFLMESAEPGFDVSGQVKAADIPRMLHLHAWYLTVATFAPELQKRDGAPIAWAVLDALEARKQGTTALVGHDTNQGSLNAILGIEWSPSPWPQNATLPGSMLRFDIEEGSDSVNVSYVYVEDFTKGGDMSIVPATPLGSPQGTMSLKSMRERIEQKTEPGCRPGTVADTPPVVIV